MRLLSMFCACLLATVVSAQEEGAGSEKKSGGPKKPAFQEPSYPAGDVYFVETFTDAGKVWRRWTKSDVKRDDGSERYNGEWTLKSSDWEGAMEGDQMLVIQEAAKHYAMSTELDHPFNFDGKESLVVQYEVNFQEGLSCGGAYVKLLIDSADLELLNDKTPYSIMFGPDKCGLSSKVHLIIRFKNPVTGEVEEKHSKQSTESMEFFDDKKTHLFTLLIRSDGVYHIILDQSPFLKGNILEDLTPPIIPSEEIDDSTDKKPADWDERETIPDPEAEKPDDWDEDAPPKIPDHDAVKPEGWLDNGPEYIPDPDAEIPEDWDEEEDGEWESPLIPNPACDDVGCGEWEPPMIKNPEYKGKWKPPLIDNPDFMGVWKPKRIPNPSYFEDDHPFDSLLTISAIGFELWTMSGSIHFDNIIICSELTVANNFASEGWILKYETERIAGGAMSMGPWLDWFIDTANNHPYLWALYAFAIVLPFVICAAFCVRSKPEDSAAKRKKTDEPTPDDPQPVREEKREEDKGKPSSSQPDGESFIAEAEEEEPEAGTGTGGDTQEEGEGEEEEGGGELSQGEASQGEGEEGGGELSQGEASQGEGEEGGGELSQGEASQGEGKSSQGEEQSQDGGQEEEEETSTPPPKEETSTATKAPRKRRQRRED